MPKSKRSKIVHLTKTDKKGKDKKVELINKIRMAVEKHTHVYVFAHENLRTQVFKELRVDLPAARFFLGKNKVMQIALGRTEQDEYRDGIAELAEMLVGNVGLLVSSREAGELQAFLDSRTDPGYARAGFRATRTVRLEAGPLEDLQHTMVEELRKLGLPVELKNGVVEMYAPHVVCREGQELSPEQCRILKHFAIPMAEFKITLLAQWHDGKVTKLADRPSANGAAAEEGSDA